MAAWSWATEWRGRWPGLGDIFSRRGDEKFMANWMWRGRERLIPRIPRWSSRNAELPPTPLLCAEEEGAAAFGPGGAFKNCHGRLGLGGLKPSWRYIWTPAVEWGVTQNWRCHLLLKVLQCTPVSRSESVWRSREQGGVGEESSSSRLEKLEMPGDQAKLWARYRSEDRNSNRSSASKGPKAHMIVIALCLIVLSCVFTSPLLQIG